MTQDKGFVSWRAFSDACYVLAQSVAEDYENIDTVLGISRGGLPGAVTLSHLLGADLEVIQAEKYDGQDAMGGVKIGTLTGVSGDTLIFDDIVDTGDTMESVYNLANGKLADDREVVTASLHVKPGRSFDPDYNIEETEAWVVYPWEGSA